MSSDKKRKISLFQRNVNINEGTHYWKKLIVDSVRYSESLLQLDRIKQTINGKERIVTPPDEPLVKEELFFSHDGSKMAYYAKGSTINSITVYSIDIVSKTKTAIKTVNLNNCEFAARSNEKCFVSNDGKFLLLSCPFLSTVYFFDVDNNSLIQTITDEQTNFGLYFAADEYLNSFTASTYDLRRDPSVYDVRSTAEGVSSVLKFYRRVLKPNNQHWFKVVHSEPAFSVFYSNSYPFYSISGTYFPNQPTPPTPYTASQLTAFQGQDESTHQLSNVSRVTDISCRGTNYALGCVALKQDQLLYKSRFLNKNSSRYSLINSLTVSAKNAYSWIIKNVQPLLPNSLLSATRDDSYFNNNNFYTISPVIFSTYSFQFKEPNNSLTDNLSYTYSFFSAQNASIYGDLSWLNQSERPHILSGSLNLNVNESFLSKYLSQCVLNHYWYDLEDGVFYTNSLGNGVSGIDNFYNKTQDTMYNYKTCLDDNYQYIITQHIRKENTKCLKISRFPIKNVNGTSHFKYFDFVKSSTDATKVTLSPIDTASGLVKIISKNGDNVKLENSFITQEEINDFFQRTLQTLPYSKPFLSDPSLCSGCNFYIQNDIIEENVQNCFVLNNYLFINFLQKTMVFKIENNICKSLSFVAEINSLKDYQIIFNNFGLFFASEDTIYRLNENNFTLNIYMRI